MAGCSAESQAAFGALGIATGLRNPSARIVWSNIVKGGARKLPFRSLRTIYLNQNLNYGNLSGSIITALSLYLLKLNRSKSMEQKPLMHKEAEPMAEEELYNGESDARHKGRTVTLRTGLRASKRSLRNLAKLEGQTPQRTNMSKPLINTKAMRYNPAGPGDYNIPSQFGEFPPVKAATRSKNLSFQRTKEGSQALKKNPSFSIQRRLHNNQVIPANLQMFQGVDTPGVGTYDPLKETIEDKNKRKAMRRLNMYNHVMARVNKSHNTRHSFLQSEPTSAHQSRTIQNSDSIIESKQAKSINQFSKPKYKHLTPGQASTSTRNWNYNDEKSLTVDPSSDKLFGTQKRFYQPAHKQDLSVVPHQYVQAFSSVVKQTFSQGMFTRQNNTSQTSLNDRNTSISPSRHLKEKEFQQLIGKSGRPIFAKDSDKHMTPAPAYYRPEVFEAYQSRTRFNDQRRSMPRQQRFRETAHIRFNDKDLAIPSKANKQVCYPELEKLNDPGPGHYEDSRIEMKRKVLHSIPSQDRNLLVNPDKPNPPIPGPQSYDLVTGLSMCSSTQYLGDVSPTVKRQLKSQDSIPEISESDIHGAANRSMMRYSKDEALKKEQSVTSIRSKTNSMVRKRNSQQPKMTLAPKMKMGVIGTAKRNTEFDNNFV